MRSLSELISGLRRFPRVSLAAYRGDDWREHLLPLGKLSLYRDQAFDLSLVKSPTKSDQVLSRGEVLVLEGELRLSIGERIREQNSYRVVDPIGVTAERDSVYLHLEM